jgi:hypothetical protein
MKPQPDPGGDRRWRLRRVVVCHQSLADVARARAGSAVVVPFRLFLGDPAVTKVVNALKSGGVIDG